MKKIITIDPGVTGAICLFDPDGDTRLVCHKPTDAVSDATLVSDFLQGDTAKCYIEDVGMRGSDNKNHKFMRIEPLIRSSERWLTIMELAGVEIIKVHPIKWQKVMRVRKQDMKYLKVKHKKDYHKEIAKKYINSVKVTLWNVDALLILCYAYKLNGGK